MPALLATDHYAEIVWLGQNPDRETSLRNLPLEEMTLGFAGLEGESRAGLTRPSCGRVTSQYPRGTEIRNTRQLSVVSEEELEQIAANMEIKHLDPAWISASVVLRGISDCSHVPPSSRLIAPSGAALVVDMENRPCVLPAAVINAELPGAGARFKPAAKGLRGVTCWVERPGVLKLGDSLRLHIPDQPAWAP